MGCIAKWMIRPARHSRFAYICYMFYLVKTPWWLKKIYPSLVWDMPADDKAIYLTFDDGPHETITPMVLQHLKLYNAKATFFCIGNNVAKNETIYKSIIDDGHATGNHTFNHLSGWKTKDDVYLQNIAAAAKYIQSNLFRPPYGRITKFQAGLLQKSAAAYNIIMWNLLSGDFDVHLSPQKCLHNVVRNARPGAIVVFHDSEKASQRMIYALPRVLEYFSEKGYVFKAIESSKIITVKP